MKRFVLEAKTDLARHLETLGEGPAALTDGRVFVDRIRIDSFAHPALASGVVVTLWPRVEPEGEIEVLGDHPDWVAVAKPAGIPTIPDHAGSSHSLAVRAKQAIGASAELHPTSRLDRDVSGVVVFAKTPRGRDLFVRARAEGRYERVYVAIACAKSPLPDHGTFVEPIGRGARPRERSIRGRDAVAAETRFEVSARAPFSSREAILVRFRPVTGRTHQIRVHASHHGAPLFGDPLYGGERTVTFSNGRVDRLQRIALHAARVRISLPGGVLDLEAPLPPFFFQLARAVGLSEEAVAQAAGL